MTAPPPVSHVSWWKWIVVGVAGLSMVLLKRRFRGVVFKSVKKMTGKTVIITGANCGIGYSTALELAKRNARVIMACRDTAKGLQAAREIRRNTPDGELSIRHLDLASLSSVRQFVDEVNREESHVDVLINNAGVFQCPYQKTEDGFEMQMGVNHLGHFLLTNLLLDKLKENAPSRVVVVSSALHKYAKLDMDEINMEKVNYNKKLAYNNSKLANNLFAIELAHRTANFGVNVYCVHPGMARTNLARHVPIPRLLKIIFYTLGWAIIKTPWEAAQTVLYCAVDDTLEGATGHYYGNCKEEVWTPICNDSEGARQLWHISERLTGLAIDAKID